MNALTGPLFSVVGNPAIPAPGLDQGFPGGALPVPASGPERASGSDGDVADSRRPRSRLGLTPLAGALVLLTACLVGSASGAATALLVERSDAPVKTVDVTGGPAIADAIGRVRQSVVVIDVVMTGTIDGRNVVQQGAGTGFVLSAGGLIATNEHVIAGAREVHVTLADGAVLPARVVGSDPVADLAVLRVQRTGLVPLAVGDSDGVRVGDIVIAIGNSLELGASPSASLGIVSALGRTITTSDGSTFHNLLQTDAAVNTGDSGGPLVDVSGRLLGVITATSASAQSVGFAIPADEALGVLNRLAAEGR